MFKKYNSIENTYREEVLEQIQKHGYANQEFVVQEKVHGSNISFWTTDGESIHTAKRSGRIEEGEVFFNYERVLIDLKPKLLAIWQELRNEKSGIEQVTFFGEIFGGAYPHADVERTKSAIKVQKGIYYSPNNHFYAFDILINTETYLDVDQVNELFEKHNIVHAKTIFRGPLNECISYPNDFETAIPKAFNLPAITPNITEGVVIKPVTPLFFNNGSRVILKNKNEKWAENTRFNKIIREEDEPTEKLLKLQEAIATYVTENRLNNVLSKIGAVTIKDFGKVIGMFNKDIITDFLKDYQDRVAELEKKEAKKLNKSFSKKAADLVKKALQTD